MSFRVACALHIAPRTMNTSNAPLSLVETIDRYVLADMIGFGGTGQVYRATNKFLGHEVALKILRAEHATDSGLRERFLREAKVASMIKHEHLVSMLDFGITPDQRHFMVMEYLPGETMASVLSAGGRIGPRAAAEIVRQIALGLEHMHGLGLVHRDLKPDNIMLLLDDDAKLHVKILDFGIAQNANAVDESPRLTEAGLIVGTPAYMAPEQIAGEVIDARTDLYALGVLLYQALAGRAPFIGDVRQILSGHLAIKPKQIAGGDGMAELAARLLAKDPQDRPQSARAVIEAIDAYLEQPAVDPRDPLDDWFENDEEVFEIVEVSEATDDEELEAALPKTRWKRTAAMVAAAMIGCALGGLLASVHFHVRSPIVFEQFDEHGYPVIDYATLMQPQR